MSAREPLPRAQAQRRLRALRELQAATGTPGSSPAPKAPRKPFQAPLKAAADLETLNGAGWARAEPRHLVALYAYLHGFVYGVPPDDLTRDPLAWLGAVSAATKLVKDEFDGDTAKAVEWVRWVWAREKRGEDRRRKVGEESTWRVGWRYMFCKRALVVDYRRAAASAKERVR